MDAGWKVNSDQHQIIPACPRCGSTHTKFCYYNNYSLTQPRYFCKGCRRYWTKGGSLRNVPIGGGCRKSRRGKSSLRMSTPGGKSKSSEGNSSFSPSVVHNSSIDLAAVYVNYLNQKPITESTQLQTHPSLEGIERLLPSTDHQHFSEFHSLHMSPFGSHVPHSSTSFLENGPQLLLGDENVYFHGQGNNFTGELHSSNDFTLLPPLPGEDGTTSSEGLFWHGSENILHDEILHSTHQGTGVIEIEPGRQNQEMVNGNPVSPFSSLNLENMFRF